MHRPKREPQERRLDRQMLLDALESLDADERAWAVRAMCPCRRGWETFEGELAAVERLTKDPDERMRRAALHVFEDAFQMKGGGLPTHPREARDEMLAARRRHRWPREDAPAGKPRRR